MCVHSVEWWLRRQRRRRIRAQCDWRYVNITLALIFDGAPFYEGIYGGSSVFVSCKALLPTLASYLMCMHVHAVAGGGGGAGSVGGAGGSVTRLGPTTALAGSSFLAASVNGTCTGLPGNLGDGFVTVTLVQ